MVVVVGMVDGGGFSERRPCVEPIPFASGSCFSVCMNDLSDMTGSSSIGGPAEVDMVVVIVALLR